MGRPLAEGAVAAGTAFTDGALRGTAPRARRAGWAFIVDNGSDPYRGKRGTLSEAYPTVLRAELRALVEILRIAIGPLVIYVDNLEVVNGVGLGRTWCCQANRDGADLWREVWDRLDDMSGLIEVKKVKAHLSLKDVQNGRITYEQWIGNGIADLAAKAACSEASKLSPANLVHSAWVRASRVRHRSGVYLCLV